jgi:hypothetical protein
VGFNIAMGLLQEIRAKRQLDRIALLTRPRVTVLRDGRGASTRPSWSSATWSWSHLATSSSSRRGGGPGRVDLDESY